MLIKINVRDLKVGMYIAELNRPWFEKSFRQNSFLIETDEQIKRVRELCTYVVIETEKGEDIEDKSYEYDQVKEDPDNPSARIPPDESLLKDIVPFEEEIDYSKELHKKTREQVNQLMEDARMGESINALGAKQLVEDMMGSLMRNKNALLCLSLIKKKDEYTSFHCINVCILVLAFGRHIKLSKHDLRILGIGALMHDIGKVNVPDEILNKPGRLTEEEFEVIKRHVPDGVKLLEHSKDIPAKAIEVVSQHHERLDGSGYAKGLKDSEIGLFGRIAAISDIYDALTTTRVYNKARTSYEALKILCEGRNTELDGQLVDHFIECMGIYPIGSLVEMQTGEVGIVVSVNKVFSSKPNVLLLLNPFKQPYTSPKLIKMDSGSKQSWEDTWLIRKVLEPGTYNIDPKEILSTEGWLYSP